MEADRGSSIFKLQLPYFLSFDFRYLWQKFQWGLEKESKEKVSVLSCTWSETRRGKRRASALDVIGQGKRCYLLTRWCTRRLIALERKRFNAKLSFLLCFQVLCTKALVLIQQFIFVIGYPSTNTAKHVFFYYEKKTNKKTMR